MSSWSRHKSAARHESDLDAEALDELWEWSTGGAGGTFGAWAEDKPAQIVQRLVARVTQLEHRLVEAEVELAARLGTGGAPAGWVWSGCQRAQWRLAVAGGGYAKVGRCLRYVVFDRSASVVVVEGRAQSYTGVDGAFQLSMRAARRAGLLP